MKTNHNMAFGTPYQLDMGIVFIRIVKRMVWVADIVYDLVTGGNFFTSMVIVSESGKMSRDVGFSEGLC